ncbi:GLYCOSYL HYDROLASE SUPERFAMILY PROTEIN [Salix purpurea]|uniref:glucan endo-1,3-beta-D-glucosidase n=1 Tax=Salix purpurea TaxID=77065 RepID=A0A9Q0Q4D9_SALPP|nr:GLYCOSYL HYDROLASE SUPERFAMILY PROTEIN [Salix purpurea]
MKSRRRRHHHQLLFTFLLFLSQEIELLTAEAFTGTYGINYGRIADNIPSPDEVVTLLRAAKIRNVRIYDADHSVLEAFSGTGLQLVVGLPNGYLKDMSANASHAMYWVKENVQAFHPKTSICGIAVGNEVLGGGDYELWEALLGAVKNVYKALSKLGLADAVQITTSHSQAVFANSYPPSSCIFEEKCCTIHEAALGVLLTNWLSVLLECISFPGIHIDAAYAALEDAGFKKMEVIVTETGWASRGDDNEAAATVSNARTYNYNLRKRLAKKKGTPLRPKMVVKAYIFAVFNENLKSGQTSERNFGLFKPDGSISYDIGFHGLKSSSADSSLLSMKAVQAQGLSKSSYILILTISTAASFLFLKQ